MAPTAIASRLRAVILPVALSLLAGGLPSVAQASSPAWTIALGKDSLQISQVAANIVRVSYRHGAAAPVASLVIDSAPSTHATPPATIGGSQLDTPSMHVRWNAADHALVFADAHDHELLRQTGLDVAGRSSALTFIHAAGQPLYGLGGQDTALKQEAFSGLVQRGRVRATAGEQGHAGAPFVWSTAGYGLLVDKIGLDFDLGDTRIEAATAGGSVDYYVFVGDPRAIFGALAKVSGASPLFPKWAMGFTNSQWGIDQKELLGIVDGYRARHIPIDNVTLDFDWKAWGEDNGEFCWNTTKFPDGPDGKLKATLTTKGIHLTGIMKPRVHLDTTEGRDAAARGLFIKGEPAKDDYFSHKPVRDIDFNLPAARAWFFNDALKHSFATGIDGWWNDEADTTGDDTQHLNMQRALYEGQRGISNQRVWSINRNFYLGAQRYAYGLWSGDIPTGFPSMAAQRGRMLEAINVGAMQWGMDGGGFRDGTPVPENYARWIEFGAFTPVFRVHGELGQKRQPWVYGPVAEKAATAAIRLRYQLIPYIYSYEYQRRVTGVGLVRPLLFDWPNDPQLRNDVDAWLFGDSLLVSPVVEPGQTAKDIYPPAGTWTDWFSGTVYQGGQRIHVAVDAKGWSDIPLFVRQGAIIPVQPPMDFVGQRPLTQLDVLVFPDTHRTEFTYYDDDGVSYDYEHGKDFRQRLSTLRSGDRISVDLDAARGDFKPALTFYLLRIHGGRARQVMLGTQVLPAKGSVQALRAGADEAWVAGGDRFGPVTYVRVAAGEQRQVTVTLER